MESSQLWRDETKAQKDLAGIIILLHALFLRVAVPNSGLVHLRAIVYISAAPLFSIKGGNILELPLWRTSSGEQRVRPCVTTRTC